MPKSKRMTEFGYTTWDGRLLIDVNRLYRSKRVRETIRILDNRIEADRKENSLPHAAKRN